MPAIRVRVPATSANLGPGFDCLGLAVGVHNEMTFRWGAGVMETSVEVLGEGADELNNENNATITALWHGLKALRHNVIAVKLTQNNRIPLARGLGSSAAAVVAGLAAARRIATVPDDRDWLLAQAVEIEHHADNVAAAIHGGLTAALLLDAGTPRCLPLKIANGLRVAFAVPSFRVSTKAARQVLPTEYPRADVVFSASRAALIVAALTSGAIDWLDEAVRDRIHTPARSRLIRGWHAVEAAARAAGGAAFISGSGPTVGAFVTDSDVDAERVAQAMVAAFADSGVAAVPFAPPTDFEGVKVEDLPA